LEGDVLFPLLLSAVSSIRFMHIPNPKVNMEATIMPNPIKERIKLLLKPLSKILNKKIAIPTNIPK
jgi:hypothetical protein